MLLIEGEREGEGKIRWSVDKPIYSQIEKVKGGGGSLRSKERHRFVRGTCRRSRRLLGSKRHIGRMTGG